jgi:CRP-like cAMP-binding protein
MESFFGLPPQPRNLLLSALPSADFELLRPNLQPIDMPRGLVLVRVEDIPKRAYFPESGVIASCVTLSDGHVFEARITGREGALRQLTEARLFGLRWGGMRLFNRRWQISRLLVTPPMLWRHD